MTTKATIKIIFKEEIGSIFKRMASYVEEAWVAACNGVFHWLGWITSVFMKFSGTQARSNCSFLLALIAQWSHLYFTFILFWVPFWLALSISLPYSLCSLHNCELLSIKNNFAPFLFPTALTGCLAHICLLRSECVSQ